MQVKTIAIERAISLLKAAGVKYAIVLEDGTKLGDLHIASELKEDVKSEPKRRIRNPGITAYVKPFIEKLELVNGKNNVIIPPTRVYSINAVQSAATGMASHMWGSGSYITSRNDKGVEFLRLG